MRGVGGGVEVSLIPGGGAKIPHAWQLNIHTQKKKKKKKKNRNNIVTNQYFKKLVHIKKKKALKKIQTSFKMHS